MSKDDKFTVGCVVSNHYGVLNRIAGLFSKRGYNIDSLAVGETENPEYSRITIVSSGDAYIREQVEKQLDKLPDVMSVMIFDEESTVAVEHLLIKIRVTEDENAALSDAINRHGGKVRDFGPGFVTVEITAPSEVVERFINAARPYGIYETCRSGAIAVSHGLNGILEIPK